MKKLINKNIKIGINFKKILIVKSKSLLLIFFFESNGSKKALNPFENMLNFPVSCWGIEYVASAIGPINILIKYLSNKS